MAQDKFDVGGMTCAACQAHVDRAVSKLDGVQSVAVNLLAGSMMVDYDPAQVSPDDICTAVDRAGYSASPVDAGTGAANSSGNAQARSGATHMESPTKKLEAAASAMRTRLIVSIVFLIPLFYIGMGHMLGWPLPGIFTDHTHSMTLALTSSSCLSPSSMSTTRTLSTGLNRSRTARPPWTPLLPWAPPLPSPGRSMPCLSWPTSWPPGKSTRP